MIAAEIEHELWVERLREHEKGFRALLDDWKNDKRTGQVEGLIAAGLSPEDLYPVYYSYIGQIGKLDRQIACDIVRFYELMNAIAGDLTYSWDNQNDPLEKKNRRSRSCSTHVRACESGRE